MGKQRSSNKNDKVKNLKGTSVCLPNGVKSWKAYYKKKSTRGKITKCAIRNCNNAFQVGAHVATKGNENGYILNMCKKHNHHTNEKWMPTKSTSKIIKITKRAAGGVSKCYKR